MLEDERDPTKTEQYPNDWSDPKNFLLATMTKVGSSCDGICVLDRTIKGVREEYQNVLEVCFLWRFHSVQRTHPSENCCLKMETNWKHFKIGSFSQINSQPGFTTLHSKKEAQLHTGELGIFTLILKALVNFCFHNGVGFHFWFHDVKKSERNFPLNFK